MKTFYSMIYAIKTSLFMLVIVMTLTMINGCRQESNANRGSENTQHSRLYTEYELGKLVVAGMSQEAITNIFGNPNATVESDTNITRWMYSFPSEGETESYHMSGFEIIFTNKTVFKWNPIMEETEPLFHPTGHGKSFGEQHFKIYTASDDMTNLVQQAESEGSADFTQTNVLPDTEFTANVYVQNNDKNGSSNYVMTLRINDSDFSKFQKWTENWQNLHKRLLLVHGDKVIAAPIINGQITTNRISITFNNARLLDLLK